MSAVAMVRVPNVWRRSWKRRRPEGGALQRGLVAAGEGRAVEVAARDAREDEVVVGRPVLAVGEPGEGGRDVGCHRDRADVAALRRREAAAGEGPADAHARGGEVDVSPAESDELAAAEAGERGREEDRRVLLGLGRPDEGPDLLGGEDLDGGRLAEAGLLDVGHRVVAELVDPTSAFEHAVEDREDLGLRSVADRQGRLPRLDALGREVLEAQGAESGQQVRPDDRAVVDDRGGLAVEVELDVAQVLVAGVGERGAGADHAGERSRARLREDVVEPGLRRALRVVASRWAAALGPRRADRSSSPGARPAAGTWLATWVGAGLRSGRRVLRSVAWPI